MTVAEMTYMWTKEFEEMKLPIPVPKTDEILLSLNTSMYRYLRTKYLYGRNVQENTRIIQMNSDDLINLIKREVCSSGAVTSIADPYKDYAKRCDIDGVVDYLHYIRSDSKISRSVPFSITNKWVQNELIDYSKVDSVLVTPFNTPIIEFPKVIFEKENVFYVLHDSYTTIGDDDTINLTYLKKPSKLVIDYTKTVCYTGAHTFVAGEKVIITGGTITYNAIAYTEGMIITITSPTTITFSSVNTGCTLGDYLIETQECELASYTHEEIVRLALTIYVDETMLKLSQRQEKKQ